MRRGPRRLPAALLLAPLLITSADAEPVSRQGIPFRYYRRYAPPLQIGPDGLPLRFTPPQGRRQPLYPAEPLPEPEVGGGGAAGGGYAIAPSLPGNIIVEVPSPGIAPAHLDRIRDVGPYLTACWRPPAGHAGFRQLTLRMGFRRTGALMGPPRLTYSAPPQTAAGQRSFVSAGTAAFVRCTPLPLTAGFGRAVAGVPFAIRFTAR